MREHAEPVHAECEEIDKVNPVGELLRLDDIQLDAELPDKARALRYIATLLARRVGLPDSEVLDGLAAREQLGSTGLGHGVAIPHARLVRCNAAAAVWVRPKAAVPFDAPDHKPVSIFLGLIVPKQAAEHHLQLLATAANMFSERIFRDKLKACSSPSAARELLAAWPDSPASGSSADD